MIPMSHIDQNEAPRSLYGERQHSSLYPWLSAIAYEPLVMVEGLWTHHLHSQSEDTS